MSSEGTCLGQQELRWILGERCGDGGHPRKPNQNAARPWNTARSRQLALNRVTAIRGRSGISTAADLEKLLDAWLTQHVGPGDKERKEKARGSTRENKRADCS